MKCHAEFEVVERKSKKTLISLISFDSFPQGKPFFALTCRNHLLRHLLPHLLCLSTYNNLTVLGLIAYNP